MKRYQNKSFGNLYTALALLFFTFAVLFPSVLFAQKDPKTLEFPDIEFAPKKPGLTDVKKGVTFYFQEDYESPVIEGILIFKSGSLYESPGKEGLASLTMRMLKAGGTKTLAPDKLEDKLDFLGSTISSYGGLRFSQIRFWTLSRNFNETWKILTDIILPALRTRFSKPAQQRFWNHACL